MKTFRDRLHDTNDIILASIVIVVAAGLIAWRIHAILGYPAKLAAKTAGKAATEQSERSTANTSENETVAALSSLSADSIQMKKI